MLDNNRFRHAFSAGFIATPSRAVWCPPHANSPALFPSSSCPYQLQVAIAIAKSMFLKTMVNMSIMVPYQANAMATSMVIWWIKRTNLMASLTWTWTRMRNVVFVRLALLLAVQALWDLTMLISSTNQPILALVRKTNLIYFALGSILACWHRCNTSTSNFASSFCSSLCFETVRLTRLHNYRKMFIGGLNWETTDGRHRI